MEYCTLMRKFDPQTISQEILKQVGLQCISPIKIEKQNYSQDLCCLDNANKYVSLNGGEVVFGWLLTIIGNVALQLTAHAVVKRKDKSLLCVTLDNSRENSVKFALDGTINKLIKGKFLPGKFLPFINDVNLNEYLECLQRHDRLRLSGADNSHFEVQDINQTCEDLYPHILALAKKHTSRNDYCFCGSRVKAKKCCG